MSFIYTNMILLCSSTVKGAVVYFPPGTYVVSSSIIQYYYTQFVGHATSLPIIKASGNFVGLGVMSSDVYVEGASGSEWYINQNNFYRQIRNFVIDLTDVPGEAYPAGIHWQVAQATSLQNVHFKMPPPGEGTNHQGIFMENGSGGFMSDLSFNGGKFGMYVGNQQFTTRDLVFRGVDTAIKVHWNWGWTWKNVKTFGCRVGISVVPEPGTYNTGSVEVVDSEFYKTETAILVPTWQTVEKVTPGATTIHLDNVNFVSVEKPVAVDGGSTLLTTAGRVASWGYGPLVDNASPQGKFISGSPLPSRKLVDNRLLGGPLGGFFERSKPQYERLGIDSFYNVVSAGSAKGDGDTDDTQALNDALSKCATDGLICFLPAGVYIITDTVLVPKGSRIVGQAWSQIMASGAKFSDPSAPRVAVQVGKKGDVGSIEMQDLLFTTRGGTAGAVLVEWNIRADDQGTAAMWDCHFRVGGAKGSQLTSADCPKLTGKVNKECMAASLLLHLTSKSSAYLENVWAWTADHDLDIITQDQIDIYVARGVLIESKEPTWLYGTAAEHNVLYQYQLIGAKNVFMGMIQTESPYYQGSPAAPGPYLAGFNKYPGDPNFKRCKSSNGTNTCAFSWGLRIVRSTDVFVFGAGLYSWFNEYSQTCLKETPDENCQQHILHVLRSNNIWLYNIMTKGVQNIVSPWSGPKLKSGPFKNTFVSTLLGFIRNGLNSGNGTSDGAAVGADGLIRDTDSKPGDTINIPPWAYDMSHPPVSCLFPCTIQPAPVTLADETVTPPPFAITIGGTQIVTVAPPAITGLTFSFKPETINSGSGSAGVATITPTMSSTYALPALTVKGSDGSTHVVKPPALTFPLPSPTDDPIGCINLCNWPPPIQYTVTNGYPIASDNAPPRSTQSSGSPGVGVPWDSIDIGTGSISLPGWPFGGVNGGDGSDSDDGFEAGSETNPDAPITDIEADPQDHPNPSSGGSGGSSSGGSSGNGSGSGGSGNGSGPGDSSDFDPKDEEPDRDYDDGKCQFGFAGEDDSDDYKPPTQYDTAQGHLPPASAHPPPVSPPLPPIKPDDPNAPVAVVDGKPQIPKEAGKPISSPDGQLTCFDGTMADPEGNHDFHAFADHCNSARLEMERKINTQYMDFNPSSGGISETGECVATCCVFLSSWRPDPKLGGKDTPNPHPPTHKPCIMTAKTMSSTFEKTFKGLNGKCKHPAGWLTYSEGISPRNTCLFNILPVMRLSSLPE